MAEFVAKMTSKGQLTVPIAVRRKLGIDPGDQVAFVIDDDGGARVLRIEHDFRSFQGVFRTPPGLETGDFDHLIDEAMSDHADDVMRGLRRDTE